jgi:hypothetical protein
MNPFVRCLVQGCQVAVLVGAVALVVWSMPEHGPAHAEAAALAGLDARR